MCSYQIIHFTYVNISGILRKNGSIDNDASIKRLAEISLAYAKAG
jgi:delta-aminolevulinic acid dehydratase/porphobilinogen synthase